MMRLYIFVVAIILFTACKSDNEPPKGIIKPDKMQAILWDVIKANAFTNEFIKKDSSKNLSEENVKLQQQIFTIHKVTKSDFYTSYDYYKSNAPLFKKMLDSMIAQGERNKYTKPVATEGQ